MGTGLYWSWKQGHGLKTILRHLLPFGLLLLPTLVLIFHTMSTETSTWWALRAYPSADVLSLFGGMARILLWFSGRLLTTAHWLPIPVYEQQLWELGLGILLLAGLALLMWHQVSPVDLWAVWTVLMLIPFLLLTEEIILDLPVGPSRYLYLATAGSSLLLAWCIQQGGWQLVGRFGSLGRYLYTASLAVLVVFCYITLKKTVYLITYLLKVRTAKIGIYVIITADKVMNIVFGIQKMGGQQTNIRHFNIRLKDTSTSYMS